MNDQLQIFTFQGNNVRISGTADSPLFCAADICHALGLGQVSRAINGIPKDGVTQSNLIDSMGRSQNANFLTESGLYRLIFKSTKPQASAFQSWVFNDVLPSIRKTGKYAVIEVDNFRLPRNYKEALKELLDRVEETEQLTLENRKLEEKVEEVILEKNEIEEAFFGIKPDADSYKELTQDEDYRFNLNEALKSAQIPLNQNSMRDLLRQNKIFYRGNDGFWYVSPLYTRRGLFRVKINEHVNIEGKKHRTPVIKVSYRGIAFLNRFYNRITKNMIAKEEQSA